MAPGKTTLVTSTTAQTGLKAFVLQCVGDTVFASITGVTGTVSATTFSDKSLIWGNITALTLTSGAVLIYEV